MLLLCVSQSVTQNFLTLRSWSTTKSRRSRIWACQRWSDYSWSFHCFRKYFGKRSSLLSPGIDIFLSYFKLLESKNWKYRFAVHLSRINYYDFGHISSKQTIVITKLNDRLILSRLFNVTGTKIYFQCFSLFNCNWIYYLHPN